MNGKRAGSVRWADMPASPRCSSNKRSYRNHREAKRALKRIQAMGLNIRCVYRCSECGSYHTSSWPRAARREAVAG